MAEEAKVGIKRSGKLNQQERKVQMLQRRKTSFWLDAKLTELEEKHLNIEGGEKCFGTK